MKGNLLKYYQLELKCYKLYASGILSTVLYHAFCKTVIIFNIATLKMVIMRLDNPYESSIYFKLAIYPKFVILISSFMVLRRYVLSSTILAKIYETNVSVSMKYRTTVKVQFQFLNSFLLVWNKIFILGERLGTRL